MCLISILVFPIHKVFMCWTHVKPFHLFALCALLQTLTLAQPPFWAASKVNSRSTQSQYIYLTSPLCQCFPGPHYHGLIFAFFTILLPKKIHILKRGWKFWAKWVQSCHLEVNFQPLSFFSLPWMIKLPPSSICAGKAVRGVVWPPLLFHLPLREILEPFLKPMLAPF